MSRTADILLERLRSEQGGYVSGEEIATALGVSRNAVWKAVASLRSQGYRIDGSPHRGYRLVALTDAPRPEEVLRGLSSSLSYRLESYEEVSSTNDLAKARARAGAPEGTAIVAECQTAGRGRRGRSWVSPGGVGLWFSLVLRPPLPPREVGLLSLLAAAAARAAVEQVTGLSAAIKWPNDLVVPQGKVGGILAELEAELDQVKFVVLGVGINVNQGPDDLPPEVVGRAASLRMATGRPVNRAALLRQFLEEFSTRYRPALTAGFSAVLAEVRRHSPLLGRTVRVLEPTRSWEGVALDLASDGALVVRPISGGEPTAVYSADVSIREG